MNANLQGCHLVCLSSLHTWGMLGARKVGPKESKSEGEQGSVLAQFAGKAEEPKQVTVATKGQKVLMLAISVEFSCFRSLYQTKGL